MHSLEVYLGFWHHSRSKGEPVTCVQCGRHVSSLSLNSQRSPSTAWASPHGVWLFEFDQEGRKPLIHFGGWCRATQWGGGWSARRTRCWDGGSQMLSWMRRKWRQKHLSFYELDVFKPLKEGSNTWVKHVNKQSSLCVCFVKYYFAIKKSCPYVVRSKWAFFLRERAL